MWVCGDFREAHENLGCAGSHDAACSAKLATREKLEYIPVTIGNLLARPSFALRMKAQLAAEEEILKLRPDHLEVILQQTCRGQVSGLPPGHASQAGSKMAAALKRRPLFAV
jgi:hypothetical protein